jgi:hypothetical protein
MTDRELIELAAKAAGYGLNEKSCELEFIWTESEYPPKSGKHGALWNYIGWMDSAELWNPLTSDADAFRLAVKLRLEIYFPEENPPIVLVWGRDWAEETIVSNPYAATRRAITRAAAEIGKAM